MIVNKSCLFYFFPADTSPFSTDNPRSNSDPESWKLMLNKPPNYSKTLTVTAPPLHKSPVLQQQKVRACPETTWSKHLFAWNWNDSFSRFRKTTVPDISLCYNQLSEIYWNLKYRQFHCNNNRFPFHILLFPFLLCYLRTISVKISIVSTRKILWVIR